jgi:hypothetical protein
MECAREISVFRGVEGLWCIGEVSIVFVFQASSSALVHDEELGEVKGGRQKPAQGKRL